MSFSKKIFFTGKLGQMNRTQNCHHHQSTIVYLHSNLKLADNHPINIAVKLNGKKNPLTVSKFTK